jgi:hypothetical protein
MPQISSTSFEEHVWNTVWLRRFSPSSGWSSECQKRLAGRYRIDFAAWQGNYRIVGDAKDKASITYSDVEKLIEDAGINKAQRLLMIVAGATQFPAGVREYADDNGVEIVWTRW